MKTIYLELARKILKADLIRIRNASVKNNSGVWGLGKDKKLAKFKQDKIDECIKALENIPCDETSEATDKEFCGIMKKIIAECISACKGEANDKGNDEGTTGPKLEASKTLVESMYDLLANPSLNLLDIPDNDKPMNVVQKELVYYLMLKHFSDRRSKGYISKIMDAITGSTALAVDKEKMVTESFQSLAKKVSRLSPEYRDKCFEEMNDFLEKLETENDKLCKEHKIAWDLPISIGFLFTMNLTPETTPDSGMLGNQINTAKSRLVELEKTHRAAYSEDIAL